MQVENFLQTLAGTWAIEVNNLNQVFPLEKVAWGKDIYFVCGFDTIKNERVGDDDFTKKSYVFVDIDIRKAIYDRENRIIDDQELIDIAIDIWNCLEWWEYWDYWFSVLSGNWLHLYYVWDEQIIDKKTYSDAVKYLLTLINAKIAKYWVWCDNACTNISRISRLPWSINTRHKKVKGETIWKLGDYKADFIVYSEKKSKHIGKLKEYANLYQLQQERDKKDSVVIQKIVKSTNTDDDIFLEINKIPARQVAEDVRGVEYRDCEKDNCPLWEWHKNMWAYYYKPYNIIVNTGSSIIKNKDTDYWTSYRLAKEEMFGWDVKKTLEYFKSKFWVEIKQKWVIPPKQEYSKIGYVYWNKTFDAFECTMSWELVMVVSKTNSWKTTFAMNMLQENKKLGKEWFYINLEFAIETVAQERRLSFNWRSKINLTDLSPLTAEEKKQMDAYVKSYLSRFKYHNAVEGATIEELIDIMLQQLDKNIKLFVIDTFSRIKGNLDGANAHRSQNATMEKLQEFAQNTGACVIVLHHTNKTWVFEGSQKIMDLSNVFISISREPDARWDMKTKFTLTKDKFVHNTEIVCDYVQGEYVLSK